MKIKLSKSQWERVGRKAGWMKKAQTDDFTELMDSLDEDNSAKMKPHIRMVIKDKDNPPGSSGILMPEREFDKKKLDLIIGKHEFNALPETIKELSRKLWYGVEQSPSWKSDKTSNYFLVVDGKAVHF